jgi:ribonuclease J
MKICIYRGTNEIGGNSVELATEKTRILMDVGTPLSSMEENLPLENYKTKCCGLYANEFPDIDAIFITHNHPEHYGLLPLINPKIPVYMSKTLHDILIKIQPLLPGDFNISHLNIHEISPNERVKIGDLTITARLVDHAPAAYAYEITEGKKRVVYTGDIRFHSNQSWKSWKLADTSNAPDYLIMEGTRLSRTEQHEKHPTEESVYMAISDTLRNSNKLAWISLSSQNLDRLVSVIRACNASGRTFVIDPYTAALFDLFHDSFATVPNADMLSCVRIYYGMNEHIANKMKNANLFFTHADKKITKTEIAKNPDRYVIKYNWALADWLDAHGLSDYDFIYSMWHGYLSRQKTWDKHKNHLIEIHTSGHADVSDLQEFVKRISPKAIIPIHTECKNDFENVFGVKTIVLNDNEISNL